MKNTLVSIVFTAIVPFVTYKAPQPPINPQLVTENIFIITTDGFRWQEVFTGADSTLINDENYTPDTGSIKALYWAGNASARRTKLMPFMWSVIAAKGQLYGNRYFDNRVNVANSYSISYPGYNEIFTGDADPSISSNEKRYNPNINLLEWLDAQPGFNGRVAAFSSWDLFPYILNDKRNGLPVNAGYTQHADNSSPVSEVESGIGDKTATRHDELTFINMMEYLQKNKPRVLYLGLGETDEAAHQGRYDLYLDHANQFDKMLAELWHWVQTTPGYKDNTTFIITTDHGRGSKSNKWTSHGEFIKGSSQTWLAVMGPHLQALGEIKSGGQLYQAQIAGTAAHLLGKEFNADLIAPAIALK